MARFRYNGGFVAALPTLGLVASPGDVAELPADPGVYWTLLTDQTVPVTTAPSVGTPPPPVDGLRSGDVLAWSSDDHAFKPTPLAAVPTKVPYYGVNVVFLGDSITIGANLNAIGHGNAFPTYAQAFVGSRFRLLANAGVSGNTTTQMLARFDTDVGAYLPNIVVLTAGTNDIAQNFPIATYQTNMAALVAKIRALGATPVICSIPPRAIVAATTAIWNQWLRGYCIGEGIQFVDLSVLADPATAGWPAPWTTDGTHPNTGQGWWNVGRVVANALSPLLPAAPAAFLASGPGQGTLNVDPTWTLPLVAPTVAPTFALTAATTGGGLGAGTYEVAVTSRYNSTESLWTSQTVTTTGATGSISIAITAAAANFQRLAIYRRPVGGTWSLVSVKVALGTYVDTGVTIALWPLPLPTSSPLPAGVGANSATGRISLAPGPVGNVLTIENEGSATTGTSLYLLPGSQAPCAVGDIIEAAVTLASFGPDGVSVNIQFSGSSAIQLASFPGGSNPPPGTYSIRLTAPAAATNVSLYASVAGVSVQAAGRTVLGVSQFTVRNLTKLGLA